MRTAAAVEDDYLHIFVALVQTVGEGGGGRLVHDTADVQTCNLTSLFGGLALAVVEVCGNGNNGIGNLCAKIILSGFLHLLENNSRNLLRRIETSVNIHTRGVVVALYYFIWYACDLVCQTVIGLTHETLD